MIVPSVLVRVQQRVASGPGVLWGFNTDTPDAGETYRRFVPFEWSYTSLAGGVVVNTSQ